MTEAPYEGQGRRGYLLSNALEWWIREDSYAHTQTMYGEMKAVPAIKLDRLRIFGENEY